MVNVSFIQCNSDTGENDSEKSVQERASELLHVLMVGHVKCDLLLYGQVFYIIVCRTELLIMQDFQCV